MGRTTVKFSLSNYSDVLAFEEGRLAPEKISRVVMDGVVDTGAARLVLPLSVVQQLNLPVTDQTIVRYADHPQEMRDIVSLAHVEILNRSGTFRAIVEPHRTDALIGAIVLEDLDLIVDCAAQKVLPRDPNNIVSEVE